MSKNNNFAVIDIGTNEVKCVCFANGATIDMDQQKKLRNKRLTQKSGENLDPQELLGHIKEYIKVAEENGIDDKKVYIVATEAFRRSTNKDEILRLIKEETGREIHIISPKREAYLSALGGLSYVKNSFKSKPNKILYIEAGGGSTEVSLLDTSKPSFLSMAETVSIPLGSKSNVQNDDLAKYDDAFKKMVSMIEGTDKVAVVVNSGAAGRILARQHRLEKYMPSKVAKDQLDMETNNFLERLKEIISMEAEDIKRDFYLEKGDPNGFLSHCKILQYAMKNFSKSIGKAPLSTTVGGLKLGLEKEIERADDNEEKIADILKKENITIGREVSEVKDEEQKDKTWRVKIKKAIADVNAESEGKFYFEEDLNKEKDKPLTFIDKNNKDNKISFSSLNEAGVQGDIQAYYAVCMTAKKLGKKINFGKFKTLEQKALLYQACLEKGVNIVNPPQPDEFKNCNNFAHINKLAAKSLKEKPMIINEKDSGLGTARLMMAQNVKS